MFYKTGTKSNEIRSACNSTTYYIIVMKNNMSQDLLAFCNYIDSRSVAKFCLWDSSPLIKS